MKAGLRISGLLVAALLFVGCASPDYYEHQLAKIAAYESSPKAQEDRKLDEKANGRFPLEIGRAKIFFGDEREDPPYPEGH